MSDPALALQGAIFAALTAAPALAGGRVYDDVPEDAAFPYITIGDGDTVGESNPCWDATEVNVQIDAWSRAPGFPEVKALAAVIRRRLAVEFAIPGFRIPHAEHVLTQYLRDPDGITRRARMQFRYLVDHDQA